MNPYKRTILSKMKKINVFKALLYPFRILLVSGYNNKAIIKHNLVNNVTKLTKGRFNGK